MPPPIAEWVAEFVGAASCRTAFVNGSGTAGRMSADGDASGFLSRWSRRKLAAKPGGACADLVEAVGPVAAPPVPACRC